MSKPYSIIFNFEDPQQLAAAANILANLPVQTAPVQTAPVQTAPAPAQAKTSLAAGSDPYSILDKKPADELATLKKQLADAQFTADQLQNANTDLRKQLGEARFTADQLQKANTELRRQIEAASFAYTSAETSGIELTEARRETLKFADEAVVLKKELAKLQLENASLRESNKEMHHVADVATRKTVPATGHNDNNAPLLQFDNIEQVPAAPMQVQPSSLTMMRFRVLARAIKRPVEEIIEDARSRGYATEQSYIEYIKNATGSS
jgi:hypothetical protein